MSHCDDVREAFTTALAAGDAPQAVVDEHLLDCASCRAATAQQAALWEGLGRLGDEVPSDDLRQRFEAVLAGYREGLGERPPAPVETAGTARGIPAIRRHRVLRRRLYQLGYGVAALIAGIAVGVGLRAGGSHQELTEMRAEVRDLRQVLALSMLQQSTASGRLQGVSLGARMAGRDPQVLAALLDTLSSDPNPNVRLAAVDALASRAGEPGVQNRLGQVLAREPSPLVQIALADALLSADGEHARQIVEPLANTPGVRQEVRQYVRRRLGKQI